MIDKKLKIEILIRIALVDCELASQEQSELEDFADSLDIHLDELNSMINKFRDEKNNWNQIKPLFEKINNEIDRFNIIDCVIDMIEIDNVVRPQEKKILNKILDFYNEKRS